MKTRSEMTHLWRSEKTDKAQDKESLATIRYRGKCDLLEWQRQEKTRQKRICNTSSCRTNKHKRRRSAKNQQNHKEKKRERRERTALATELHNSTNALTLFLLLWFKTPPAESLGTLFNSLIHSNVEWESVPKRHVPYHRMIHLCHYGLAWDETCEMYQDFLRRYLDVTRSG